MIVTTDLAPFAGTVGGGFFIALVQLIQERYQMLGSR
jgi:hypothetical protein